MSVFLVLFGMRILVFVAVTTTKISMLRKEAVPIAQPSSTQWELPRLSVAIVPKERFGLAQRSAVAVHRATPTLGATVFSARLGLCRAE